MDSELSLSGTRVGHRHARRLDVTLRGRDRDLPARSVDVSCSGVLVQIEDASFVDGCTDPLDVADRLRDAFGRSFLLVLDEGRACLPASFARMARGAEATAPLVACRFRRAPSASERGVLGLLATAE